MKVKKKRKFTEFGKQQRIWRRLDARLIPKSNIKPWWEDTK